MDAETQIDFKVSSYFRYLFKILAYNLGIKFKNIIIINVFFLNIYITILNYIKELVIAFEYPIYQIDTLNIFRFL